MSTRPIGIPTFEDKVLQRAVSMLLDAVYEQDFLEFLVRIPAWPVCASGARCAVAWGDVNGGRLGAGAGYRVVL